MQQETGSYRRFEDVFVDGHWTEKKLVEKGREAAGEQLLGRRLAAGCLGC